MTLAAIIFFLLIDGLIFFTALGIALSTITRRPK